VVLIGPNAGGGVTGPVARISEPQRNTPAAPPARQADNVDGGNAVGENAPAGETDAEPTLPASQAEQTVFDMYYQMSFARPEESWSYLSQRLQSEIGSVDQWAEQEDIYTYTYMEFTSYPTATISGNTAEVAFEVRLDHTWGSELLSGTWTCVVENGEWKLDRLENESVQLL
jgi:eukaryotic-like serine/threonine-protein kinase